MVLLEQQLDASDPVEWQNLYPFLMQKPQTAGCSTVAPERTPPCWRGRVSKTRKSTQGGLSEIAQNQRWKCTRSMYTQGQGGLSTFTCTSWQNESQKIPTSM